MKYLVYFNDELIIKTHSLSVAYEIYHKACDLVLFPGQEALILEKRDDGEFTLLDSHYAWEDYNRELYLEAEEVGYDPFMGSYTDDC